MSTPFGFLFQAVPEISHLRILVVTPLAAGLRYTLDRCGAQITYAATPAAAKAATVEHPYDIALVDIEAAGGFGLVADLKRICVVVAMAAGDSGRAVLAFLRGAVAFIDRAHNNPREVLQIIAQAANDRLVASAGGPVAGARAARSRAALSVATVNRVLDAATAS